MPLPLWLASGAVEDGLHEKYPRRFCQLANIITSRPAEAFRSQREQIEYACKEVNQTGQIKDAHEDVRGSDSLFGDLTGYAHNMIQDVTSRITRATHNFLTGVSF